MGKKLQHWIAVLLVVFLGLSAAPHSVKAAGQDIVVLLDGKQVSFDVPPQLIKDRTFVPFRAILEAMGAKVWWDRDTETAYAEKDGSTIRMPVGSDRIFRNEQAIEMDVSIQLVQGRTLIPLRFVSQALGAEVDWKDATSTSPFTVTVKSPLSASSLGTAANIEVINGDGKVSAQKIQQVQNLLHNSQISQKVSRAFGLSFNNPIQIYLAADKAGYRQTLLNHGRSSAYVDQVVQVSAGLASRNDIYIPLYSHSTEKDLKNVLAHELIHVLFNQNGLDQMPSWVNEGLCWREALKIEFEDSPEVVYEGRKKELRHHVLGAKQAGKLIGLLNDSLDTITANPGYNVEIQDWVAVEHLIGQYGFEKVLNYFSQMKKGVNDPFAHAFGLSQQDFETNFNSSLDSLIRRADRGMKVTFKVTNAFHGEFLILPKGHTNWRIFSLAPGEYTVTILPDGTVTGLGGSRLNRSTGSSENDVIYIGLPPDSNVTENGNVITSAGFALKYGYGEYFLLNGWKTYSNGTADYPETNSLLGVEILSIQSL